MFLLLLLFLRYFLFCFSAFLNYLRHDSVRASFRFLCFPIKNWYKCFEGISDESCPKNAKQCSFESKQGLVFPVAHSRVLSLSFTYSSLLSFPLMSSFFLCLKTVFFVSSQDCYTNVERFSASLWGWVIVVYPVNGHNWPQLSNSIAMHHSTGYLQVVHSPYIISFWASQFTLDINQFSKNSRIHKK